LRFHAVPLFLSRLLGLRQARFRSPASRAALQQMAVAKKAVEHGEWQPLTSGEVKVDGDVP
jgi:hypothetical protein